MSERTPPSYVLRRTFADVDELAVETRQWDLDFWQLDRGKFHGELLQFGTAHVHVGDARFCRRLNQKGTPPAGMRTVGIPADRDMRFLFRGHVIDDHSLIVFPRGAELASVSGPDFHVYTCSFPEGLLSTLGQTLEVGELDDLCAGADAIRVGMPVITKLRCCLLRLCQTACRDPAALTSPAFADQLTRELPSQVIAAIAEGCGRCPPATGRNRFAVVERAEAYMARHAHDNVKIGDICQAAGVSERTLEYAFLERFGIGPKEYLTAFRLVGVRRQLRAADPRRAKVTEVANAWGFWHLGKFAADYRQRFKELPSETLRHRPV